MKKIISVLILLVSVSATASDPVTYHLQIKNWPDRKKTDAQIKELTESNSCFDVNGSPTSPEVDCHKFVVFKSDEALKPYKKNPTDIKMVIGYKAGQMTVMRYKWDGKKMQRILNAGGKFNVNDIKFELIQWSFK